MSKELPKIIQQARIKLMLDEPYLASCIARFPLINAKEEGYDWCQTMAVDGFYIYINPDFCESLSEDEIKFVLAHEVMHCVLGHADRRKNRDRELWNIATDYATNLKLSEFGLKMPKVGLIDTKYTGLTSEEIYEEIHKKLPPNICVVRTPHAKKKGERSERESSEKTQDDRKRGGSLLAELKNWDLHLDETSPHGQEQRAKEFPSPDERKRMRISILKEIKGNVKGNIAGKIESEFKIARGENIPWHILLAKFFTGLRRDNYRLMPPNKKHIWRNIYLPSVGVPGPSHIVVAIDTSGSMSDNDLKKVISEVDSLRSYTQCSLTLIQCDADIQKIEEFDEYQQTSFERYKVYGRGGTDFKPVFSHLEKKLQNGNFQFDTLIFLTDGYGDFPKKPPQYPVLWIITKGGINQVPFGEKIILE